MILVALPANSLGRDRLPRSPKGAGRDTEGGRRISGVTKGGRAGGTAKGGSVAEETLNNPSSTRLTTKMFSTLSFRV